MYAENFVHFFTVAGFFVGIIFGILKSFTPENLLTYTLLITIFFYLFSHLIVAFYYRTKLGKAYFFAKDEHEKTLDFFVKEINKREKILDVAVKITEDAIATNTSDAKAFA
ncbi:MAG: hypothetical protein WC144_08135 [Sulfurimonas sp.]|jgi:hypothetical protein|nr:hypothetical protein [Sulfurimonadaceae bacterium]